MSQIAITALAGRAQPSTGRMGVLSYFYSTVEELPLEGSYAGEALRRS